MREIKIDAPGAGIWIMERVDGSFRDGADHSFSSHEDGKILGGFALTGYMGLAMSIHMAARSPRWFSRELAWIAFHYPFVQLGVRKLIAPVSSGNFHSETLCRRAGWREEARLRDLFPDADLILFTMTRDQCRWLNYTPARWHSNRESP
jgi:RimJ/RimL family protein N-acetyltransferase